MKNQEPVIFIVDDDPSVPRALRRLLHSAGYYNVQIFASAEDFLHKASVTVPCLLIIDILLPRMSGIGLYHDLRDRGEPIPTIFISAMENELTRAKTECPDGLAYLQKPFASQTLFSVIRRLNSSFDIPMQG